MKEIPECTTVSLNILIQNGKTVDQGCPILLLVIDCPAKFSYSNTPEATN